jgi:hypothetical protein
MTRFMPLLIASCVSWRLKVQLKKQAEKCRDSRTPKFYSTLWHPYGRVCSLDHEELLHTKKSGWQGFLGKVSLKPPFPPLKSA